MSRLFSNTMRMCKANLLKTAVTCSAILLSATLVLAGDFSAMMRLMALQVYNDNIFFIDENSPTKAELRGEVEPETETDKPEEKELSDFITTISPGVDLGYETDWYKAELNATLDFIKYQDLNELDDIDYFYQGKLDYDINNYTRFAVDASFKQDSSADRDLQTSGLILGTYIRDKQDYQLEFEHDITEISQVKLSYGYQQDDFKESALDDEVAAIEQAEIEASGEETTTTDDEEEILTPAEELLEARRAEDSKLHIASLTYSQSIDGLLPDGYSFLSLAYLHYTTEKSIQNNVTMLLGGGYQINELFSTSIDGGVSYSSETYDDVQLQLLAEAPYYDQIDTEQSQDSWGPAGHAQIEYRGLWTTARIKFGYDIQPASGRGTFTERAEMRLDITRQLSEFFKIRGFTSYIDNNRDGVDQLPPVATEEAQQVHNDNPKLKKNLEKVTEQLYAVDETYINMGLELSYAFNRYVDLACQYTYTVSQEELVESDARQNRVFLRLGLKYPF